MALHGLKPSVRLISTQEGQRLVDDEGGRTVELTSSEARLLELWDGRASMPALAQTARSAGVTVDDAQAVGLHEKIAAAELLAVKPSQSDLPAPAVPRFRRDLSFERPTSTQGIVQVTDSKRQRTFSLYDFELSIGRLLDGRRSTDEVIVAAAKIGIPVTQESLTKFIRQLRAYGFIDDAQGGAEGAWPKRREWATDVRELYQTALRFHRQDKPEEAIGYLDALLEIDPGNGEAVSLREQVVEQRLKAHPDITFEALHGDPAASALRPRRSDAASPASHGPSLKPMFTAEAGAPAGARSAHTPSRGSPPAAALTAPARGLRAGGALTPADGSPPARLKARHTPHRGLPAVPPALTPAHGLPPLTAEPPDPRPPYRGVPAPPRSTPTSANASPHSLADSDAPTEIGLPASSSPSALRRVQEAFLAQAPHVKARAAHIEARLREHLGRLRASRRGRIGLVVGTSALVLLLAWGLFHPVPRVIRVPGEVSPVLVGEPVVRRSGVLAVVKVGDRVAVSAGEHLAILESGALQHREAELSGQLDALRTRLTDSLDPPDPGRLAEAQARVRAARLAWEAAAASVRKAKRPAPAFSLAEKTRRADLDHALEELEGLSGEKERKRLMAEKGPLERELSAAQEALVRSLIVAPDAGVFLIAPVPESGQSLDAGSRYGRVVGSEVVVRAGGLPKEASPSQATLIVGGRRLPNRGATLVDGGLEARFELPPELFREPATLEVPAGTRAWVAGD